MRIGELAAALGVNPRTIRYYERIGLLPEPARTSGNYRIYDAADAERVGFIKSAQRLGLTLDAIGEILALREQGTAPCAYVRRLLASQVHSIIERIAELESLRHELDRLQAQAERLPQPPAGYCPIIEHSTAATRQTPAAEHGRR